MFNSKKTKQNYNMMQFAIYDELCHQLFGMLKTDLFTLIEESNPGVKFDYSCNTFGEIIFIVSYNDSDIESDPTQLMLIERDKVLWYIKNYTSVVENITFSVSAYLKSLDIKQRGKFALTYQEDDNPGIKHMEEGSYAKCSKALIEDLSKRKNVEDLIKEGVSANSMDIVLRIKSKDESGVYKFTLLNKEDFEEVGD